MYISKNTLYKNITEIDHLTIGVIGFPSAGKSTIMSTFVGNIPVKNTDDKLIYKINNFSLFSSSNNERQYVLVDLPGVGLIFSDKDDSLKYIKNTSFDAHNVSELYKLNKIDANKFKLYIDYLIDHDDICDSIAGTYDATNNDLEYLVVLMDEYASSNMQVVKILSQMNITDKYLDYIKFTLGFKYMDQNVDLDFKSFEYYKNIAINIAKTFKNLNKVHNDSPVKANHI